MILVIFLAAAGCDASAPSPRAVVATVNGEAITAEVFERTLALRMAALAEELVAEPGGRRALKKRVLEELVTRRLLLQEAARRSVVPSPGDVERRVAELSEGFTQEEYAAMLAEKGSSSEDFRSRVTEDLTIERLLEEVLEEPEAAKPEAVEAYYREHLADLQRPIRARTLHLVVADAQKAERLRKDILAGGDFAELARQHSLGPEAARNGELGWVSPGQLPEAFDEAIFALKVGEVSPVVTSPYGYHLFKLLALKPAGIQTLAEARPTIVSRMGGELREARYRRWMAERRKRATVVIHLADGEADL